MVNAIKIVLSDNKQFSNIEVDADWQKWDSGRYEQ